MYIIIELQTNDNGTIGNIVTAVDSRRDAESQYHAKLSTAAISALPAHAVVMMTGEGDVIKRECYHHAAAPAGEAE